SEPLRVDGEKLKLSPALGATLRLTSPAVPPRPSVTWIVADPPGTTTTLDGSTVRLSEGPCEHEASMPTRAHIVRCVVNLVEIGYRTATFIVEPPASLTFLALPNSRAGIARHCARSYTPPATPGVWRP